jgi:hypothetical protein
MRKRHLALNYRDLEQEENEENSGVPELLPEDDQQLIEN